MFKHIVQSIFTKGMVAVINFLILLISSRYLGVSTRGEISIFLLNIFFIQIINEVYTGYSIIHFIPRYDLRKIIIVGLMYTLVSGFASNTLIFILGKHLAGYEKWSYLISFLVILNTFNCVIILGKQKVRAYNLLSFIQPLFLLLGIVVFVFGFKIYTVEAYIFPLLFSFCMAMVISVAMVAQYFISKNQPTDFNLKHILKGGLEYQAGILMFIFCNRFSYYLMGKNSDVGLYSAAATLTESVLIIAMSVSPVLMAKVANAENSVQNAYLAFSLSKLSFIISVFAILIILFINESFYISVLGSGFAGIKFIMLRYSPAVLLASIFIVMSNYFLAYGKQTLVLKSYALGFISTIIFAPLLIKKYGINGAAYSTGISYFLMAVGICYSFSIQNKIPLARFFSLKEDYANFVNNIKSL